MWPYRDHTAKNSTIQHEKIEISVVGNGSTWKNRDTNSRILLSTITMLHDTNTIITLDKICNPQDTE